MDIPYNDRISPYPIYVNEVGYFISPKLSDIYKLSCDKYYFYLSLIKMTPKEYLKVCSSDLNDKLKSSVLALSSIYPIIVRSNELQQQYCDIFTFFFDNQVLYDKETNYFKCLKDEKICGCINEDNYTDVCNIISVMNNISIKEDVKKLKFKNSKAQEVFEFLEDDSSSEQSKKTDDNMILSNIISAVCARHNSINMINVWDMTVCQLYDQFFRLFINTPFDINAVRWAAYGEKDYDYSVWYKKIE